MAFRKREIDGARMTTAAPMLLTYKYRLCPEARQHRALERILEQQRGGGK